MASYHPIGNPFTVLDEVPSTNNYAMAQVQANLAGHGATWFTRYQSEGKGQRGNAWLAEPNQNILQSMIVQPVFLSMQDQFMLTVVLALSCYDFFALYAIDQVSLKWTNDVYWRDRKAGGILIENIIKGKNWQYAVAGVGININQVSFPEHLKNPVSLKQITGKHYDVVEKGKELCYFVENRWQQLKNGAHAQLLAEYNAHLFKLNEPVKLKFKNAIIETTITGVNAKGQLLINTGQPTAVNFGEVEWIIN